MATTWRTLVAVLAGGLVLAGCGGGNDYKNRDRPPSPINVTAFVGDKGVSVSPKTFGAGPIVVIVTNQSNASQDVTLQNDGSSGGSSSLQQSTGPINPGDTGQFKVDVNEGTYQLRAGDQAIRPARVTVGPARRSAQNDLLQP